MILKSNITVTNCHYSTYNGTVLIEELKNQGTSKKVFLVPWTYV